MVIEYEDYLNIVRTDYCAYVQHVHEGRWIPSKFHKFLCDTVQSFIEEDTGHAYDILCISTPPQHGKSETITQTLPSWYLGRNPYKKVIEISYNDDFAEAFGRANKFKIQDFCNELFGIKLARFPNSSKNFKLDNNVGGMLSGGVTSGITGNGANLMIIDDPIKTRQEAYSETTRNSLFGEWCTSYKTRLASGAKVIVIMTRWHEDDLVGRLIETEENIRYVNIPCEAEENDPLGREVGEALCSEIGKGDSWLADFKKAYVTQEGTMTWNAMFQGHPSSMEGNIFRREWWQFYDTLPEVTDWLMSADCTFKDKEDNDFVSIQVWAKLGANMYLVDRVKKHLNLPDTMREIIRLRSTYPMCKTTLIEDKANGSAIIDILRRSMTGIIAVQPKGGKVARANAIVGAVESGNVFLPRKSFTADFIDELASFPNGKHDDDVDACSQALTRLIYNKSGLKEAKSIDFIKSAFPEYNKKGKTAFGRGSKINVI